MPISLRIYKRVFIAACFLLSCLSSFAQNAAVTIAADKSNILIGEQVKLKVAATFPEDMSLVDWISVPDSMPHFEVIDRSKIDSAFTDNKLTGLSQTITLTSFDSGQWNIPSFPISVRYTADSVQQLNTDTVPVGVYYVTSDTTNQIRDIKPIRQVPPASKFWYWVIGAVLVLSLIAVIVWIFYLRKKKNITPYKTVASAYADAMAALDKLSRYDLSDAQQVKIFHSKLAEIFKLYFSYKQNINRLSQTTGELLISVKEADLDTAVFSKLAAALRLGDAVKFAKYLPPSETNRECLTDIKRAIESLNNQRAV